jgi:clan AA aspartic protease (TIGR02281 family)
MNTDGIAGCKKLNKRRFKRLLFGVIFVAGMLLTSVGFGLFQPAMGEVVNPPAIGSEASSNQTESGQQLLQQVIACMRGKIPNPQQASMEVLQTASSQCVFEVVVLNPDGRVRADASDRLTALVEFSGVSFPQPASKGQANIQLKKVPDSQVFAIPVKIGQESKPFLLDTGASASIIDSQIAKELGLASRPVPTELFKYTVVGNNCSNVEVTLHPLPVLAVDSATVEGLNGMGLPPASIPGKMAGVLGIDFLSSFDMVLNPKTLQLKLLPPSQTTETAIPLVGKLGNITAQVQVNRQGSFTFVLDTGADLNVISTDLAQKLSLDLSKAKEIEVLGFCGTEKGKQIKLDRISLQQHQANEIEAIVLDSNIFKLLGVDGIIGQNFLNRYQQHWRFSKRNAIGFADSGSLVLTPLSR